MIKEKTLGLLEFPKLLGLISESAHSEASHAAILRIRPLSETAEIKRRFGLTSEIRKMANTGEPLKLSVFPDIEELLRKIRPEGAFLDSFELARFIPVLQISADISVQISGRPDAPLLQELTGTMNRNPELLKILLRSIDAEGNILDEASFRLSELRGEIRRKELRIRKNLEEMVRDDRISVFLQDDFMTKRAGRWVLPVRMDSKGQVPGVVHDVSKSGETAFIEPLGIIHHSNELENLIAEQKAEEIRILREICSRLRKVAGEIEADYRLIVDLDVLNSIAVFAERLGMQFPLINTDGKIRISDARHPLLVSALARTGGQVVPLEVALGGQDTVMVITGSNAGGKTIAMKTIGLLILMALSGMPVPAESASTIPLIDNLLVDIGDEQSIEDNLSTFSAHISHITGILSESGPMTCVLLDELGTGTDPQEGAALACAILKEIRKSGALVFATTHLTDIKGFVHRTEGMLNASMEFDSRTLTPLYRLRTGEPGQSHALDVAAKYGLPGHIVISAREMLGKEKLELDRMISDLNSKRTEYEAGLLRLQKELSAVEEKGRIFEEKLARAEEMKKRVLAEAYGEAQKIVSDVKRQMYALMDEMKRDEKARRDGLRNAELLQKEMGEKLRQYGSSEKEVPEIGSLNAGDTIFVRTLGADAVVSSIDVKHGRVRVRAGNRELEIPVSDTGTSRGGAAGERNAAFRHDAGGNPVTTRLNLVGLRVDEALSRLEPFLNQTSLAGLSEITVIHGIGKGILSRAVREHISGHPLVKSFRSGEPGEGGAGVTVITLV